MRPFEVTRKVVRSEAAVEDMLGIVDDLVAAVGLRAALAVDERLDAAIESLDELGNRGRAVPELRARGITTYRELTWPLPKVGIKTFAREDQLLMTQLASWYSLPEQISGTRPSDMIDLDPLRSSGWPERNRTFDDDLEPKQALQALQIDAGSHVAFQRCFAAVIDCDAILFAYAEHHTTSS
jgi:plasmid stabilization system protein ParE